MSEKTKADILKEELFYSPEHAAYSCEEGEIEKADKFCEGYMKFLDACKTEREAVAYTKALAEKEGFKPFDPQASYKAGDKVYYDNRGKALILCVFGTESLEKGAKIVASHVDSPRLDVKPNPLYEDADLALFKTHYYGGIKKYQWTAIPLSLHGVIFRKDGSSVNVRLGDEDGDPRFVVTDLLPHLDKKQAGRPLDEAIPGENLNILVGSRPFGKDKGSEMVKLNIMKLLNDKYGIVEADFLSAELEMVPAFKAADIGFDRSMIGSYGHDDRVCSHPALRALLDTEGSAHTVLAILADNKAQNEMRGKEASRQFKIDEEKKALNNLRNELQRERSLLSTQSASLSSQKEDFNELRELLCKGVECCTRCSRGKTVYINCHRTLVSRIG